MKRVLVACEFSGTVREAFRKRGFDAYSCDVLPADDKSPYHWQGNVLDILKGFKFGPYSFCSWDLMIAHPPCTYLCNSGVCWLYGKKGNRTKKNYTDSKCKLRWFLLERAMKFFRQLQGANILHVAIENPIPHKFARDGWGPRCSKVRHDGIGKYTQIIQPHQFGHAETKATCLWLKNLPKLRPTNQVVLPADRAKRMRLHYLSPGPNRWKIRSKTYQGIADAMAEQWGDYIMK